MAFQKDIQFWSNKQLNQLSFQNRFNPFHWLRIMFSDRNPSWLFPVITHKTNPSCNAWIIRSHKHYKFCLQPCCWDFIWSEIFLWAWPECSTTKLLQVYNMYQDIKWTSSSLSTMLCSRSSRCCAHPCNFII